MQASDGRFDTLARVLITVEQPRNSGLHFTKDQYSAKVTENDKAKRNLVVVQPIGPGLHQHFTFSLLNNQELFSVGETSGVVQTKGVPFDREQRENYTVVVQVGAISVFSHLSGCLWNLASQAILLVVCVVCVCAYLCVCVCICVYWFMHELVCFNCVLILCSLLCNNYTLCT